MTNWGRVIELDDHFRSCPEMTYECETCEKNIVEIEEEIND